MKVPRHPHSGRSLALRLVPSKRPNRWLNSADRVEAQDVPLVEPRAAMKKRWTGGTAMKVARGTEQGWAERWQFAQTIVLAIHEAPENSRISSIERVITLWNQQRKHQTETRNAKIVTQSDRK